MCQPRIDDIFVRRLRCLKNVNGISEKAVTPRKHSVNAIQRRHKLCFRFHITQQQSADVGIGAPMSDGKKAIFRVADKEWKILRLILGGIRIGTIDAGNLEAFQKAI